MNAAIFIYLAEVLNNIGIVLGIIGVGGGLVAALLTLIYYVECGEYHGQSWAIWVPAVSLVLSLFVPSTKTMYMMAGAVLGEQALESKVGQQLKEMLELKLDQELAKMREGKKK